ncbi:acetyltransferase (GNAT) family protein [Alicyclobacillus sacchari]|uniref:Acetyltransferase (GNAT) family protein n=1 Tax=Alicyclobacillus sacchari TaxID=392010 RepID=A0A4R8LVV1_9BACL|nr:acetyltransferase (GNAT) family protein [Alicyclobacillus sacchari]
MAEIFLLTSSFLLRMFSWKPPPEKGCMNVATTDTRIKEPKSAEDWAWLYDVWIREWGGDTMISKGKVYFLRDVAAVIAIRNGNRVGAATYVQHGNKCELLSINAITEGTGVGSALLRDVEERARTAGCEAVELITSNDNLQALRFYQRRGYRITAVYLGAIDEARVQKPSIPVIGYQGIPIHDEIELIKWL